MYGYVLPNSRNWREFATKQQCLASARKYVAGSSRYNEGVDNSILIFHYPKGVKMFEPEYNVYTNESDKYYDGSVWSSNMYPPQYQPKGNENKFSYDLKTDGTLGGRGWIHPQYVKATAQKSKNAPAVYGFNAGRKWVEYPTLKEALKASYALGRNSTSYNDLIFKYPKGKIIQNGHMMLGDWEKHVIGEVMKSDGDMFFIDEKTKVWHDLNPDGTFSRGWSNRV